MRLKKRTYLRLKKEASSVKWKIIAVTALFAVLLFALMAFAELQPQTFVKQDISDTYSKYFFSRDECRYIFPAGSCIVDDKYCNQNSYDYQVIELEPYANYCMEGTIVYTKPVENQKPRIQSPKDGECDFTVEEGDTVRLRPEGYDPDPDIGPAGKLLWTFFNPFDKNGVWRTTKGDAGTKWSKVELSDGELKDEREFCVEVLKTNSAPELSGLRDITAKEGERVTIRPVCTDPDGDKVVIRISGFMTSDEKTLKFDDAGKHDVTVTCMDSDGEKDAKTISITVIDVNRAPTLDVPGTVTVDEGKTVRITAKVADPDGDKVTVTFENPFAEDGTWQTKKGDSGTYQVKVVASDGAKQVTKTVRVIVNKVNSAPKISSMSDIKVYEGDTIELRPRISDPDGDKVTVKYTGWMSSATKKTGYDDAGEYDVTVTAKDSSGEEDVEKIHITVLNRNRSPVITKLQ